MEDVHKIFTQFKQEFPDVYADYERLGQGIHQRGGPLDDKTRALLKLAVSGAAGHLRALETHVRAAREAEVNEEEINTHCSCSSPRAASPPSWRPTRPTPNSAIEPTGGARRPMTGRPCPSRATIGTRGLRFRCTGAVADGKDLPARCGGD